jgi:hypothetical protein
MPQDLNPDICEQYGPHYYYLRLFLNDLGRRPKQKVDVYYIQEHAHVVGKVMDITPLCVVLWDNSPAMGRCVYRAELSELIAKHCPRFRDVRVHFKTQKRAKPGLSILRIEPSEYTGRDDKRIVQAFPNQKFADALIRKYSVSCELTRLNIYKLNAIAKACIRKKAARTIQNFARQALQHMAKARP